MRNLREKPQHMGHRRSGGAGSYAPQVFIFCIERRYPKQNAVARLKSQNLPPLKLFGSPLIRGDVLVIETK